MHDKIISKIGGLGGYNDKQIGYLTSALEHIKNDKFYPTIADKITHLMFACIKFHPFLDDKYSDNFAQNMEEVVVNVAMDKISKDKLNEILKEFIEKAQQ